MGYRIEILLLSAFVIETDFSASKLLEHCHQLEAPALFYSGTSGGDERSPKKSAFAILGCFPDQHLQAHTPNELKQLLTDLQSVTPSHGHNRDTFRDTFRDTLRDTFQSGWAGYFSYDAGHALMNLPTAPGETPLAEFYNYPLTLRLDLQTDHCQLQNPRGLPEQHVASFINQITRCLNRHCDSSSNSATDALQPSALIWSPHWTQTDYDQAFERVQAYLHSGDAYQVNLAMSFHCADDLRSISPHALLTHFNAPFSGYFRTPNLTLFSVSPERFIQVSEQHITTSPIKGTIPRGKTPEEDQANRTWLKNSQKNRAENLMIVDLLRNDIGRSAQTGSVNVTRLFDIEPHANVHHMVSTIEANKQPELSPLEVIINAFPGGSITGAPKRRAMEIITELESGPRGLYCGSFGYFDDSGLTDFNILIRSITATEQGATCWGGGGLVADSTAQDEYDEIHGKIDRILEMPITRAPD